MTDKESNEQKFSEYIEDYIKNGERYQYGGVVNALWKIASVLEKEHQATGIENYKIALKAVEEAAEKSDLLYE